MSTRVYIPTTIDGLAAFVLEGGIAETAPRVQAADESEEAEYDALMATWSWSARVYIRNSGYVYRSFCIAKHHSYQVIEALNKLGGRVMRYNFTQHGLTTWTI